MARTDQALAACLVGPLVWASIVDLRHREIPNLASWLVGFIGVIAWQDSPQMLLINALSAGVIGLGLAALGEWAWRTSAREALGLGDVKLIAAGTVAVGVANLWVMLLLAAIGGITSALVARARNQEGIPFGPFLAYGLFVSFLLSVHAP